MTTARNIIIIPVSKMVKYQECSVLYWPISHFTPLARPLAVPLPIPDPLGAGTCEPPLPDVILDPPVLGPYPELKALPTPLPLPLVPLAPRTAVPACLCLSSSSAFRLASSRLLSSSAARLSAACAFSTCSFSISATS